MNPKTYSAKIGELDPQWYVVDAEGMVLGRLANMLSTKIDQAHEASAALDARSWLKPAASVSGAETNKH